MLKGKIGENKSKIDVSLLEVHVTHSASSAITIEKLQITFTALGLPQTVVTDNGTCFTSQEFQVFLKQNGIQHVRMSAYHQSSNGLAERYVQTAKENNFWFHGVTISQIALTI